MTNSLQISEKVVVARQDLQQLLDVLAQKEYQLIGPTINVLIIMKQEKNS